MKILLGINSLSSGGAEVFVTELAVAYRERNHEVTLIVYAGVLDNKGKDLFDKLIEHEIVVIDLSGKPRYLMPFFYIAAIWRIRPDCVHSNLEQTDLLLGITRLFNTKACYIRTLHNIKVHNGIPLFLHRWMFNRYDHNIGCSLYTKEHYELQNFRQKITVINNGIDLSRVEQVKKHSSVFSEYFDVQNDELIFIVVGTLKKRFGKFQKGHDLIFKAFNHIENKNYRVVFIGDVSNLESDFPDASYKNPRFTFLGIVPDVLKYLVCSNVLLAPSRFEGLPISTIEGVCCGLPLICSNIEGFAPFHRASTLVTKNEDAEDLKEKILYMFDNYKRFEGEGKKQTENYRSMFDINLVVGQYLKYVKP